MAPLGAGRHSADSAGMAARATLGSAVVLAALMVASVAAAAASPYVVHPVLHVYRANISAVQSHDDMAELYASSVKQDLRPWLSRRPPLADLQRHLHAYTPQDSRRVLLIRGGELYEAFSEEPWHCRLPCGRGLRQLWSALARWLRSPLLLQQGNSTRAGLPDAVFAVNTSPLGACRNETCGAPVLSLVKHAHDDEDILVPGAADMGLPLVYYPWDKKSDKAVFRGADLCPPNPRFGFCPRR